MSGKAPDISWGQWCIFLNSPSSCSWQKTIYKLSFIVLMWLKYCWKVFNAIKLSIHWLLNSQIADLKWAASSEFVSSSIPSWKILITHAQPFRGARDLAFCLKVPLDSLLVWTSSRGSGETARMRRLACTFAARIGDTYQIRLTRPK